jgi:hypothetical protein
MKFKLSYKIFVAFTLMAIIVVALMVGLMRFYVARNFTEYESQSFLERFSDFADALASEYEKHQGWQTLKDNPGRWAEILHSRLPVKEFYEIRHPRRPPGVENKGSGSEVHDLRPPNCL